MISYRIGDATEPQVHEGIRIITHVNNDRGGWGSGFVVALSKKWSQPEKKYREWSINKSLQLGQIQIVKIHLPKGNAPLYVANMIAQHKFVSKNNPVAIRYNALTKCLIKLDKWAENIITVRKEMDKINVSDMVSFHMPRIGCGLAGGNWDTVSSIINTTLNSGNIYVYDLPERT